MLTDLAARHHVAPSTMSRTVDALVERGWVARTGAPDDRRKVLLALTEHGAASLDMLFEQSCGIVAELMAPLDAQERIALVSGLTVLQHLANHVSSASERESN
jgi:DNA-binding MarR family transcriptional regulator